MNKIITAFLILLLSTTLFAQFPGAVGTTGTTSIYKDSSAFISWATNCSVKRGYQDISNTSLGFASVGDSTMALGIAGSNGVVSLGDGGFAIVTFVNPITNGNGFDFAVFENSFSDVFLELAFVEVSSDGVNFFRFPATSNTQITTQIGPFDNTGDATKINNLAGKYRAQYGTPFDLQELIGLVGLDVNNITQIKIIDVVGSINPLLATYDINNNPINDPFPTGFASSGFDLDAVGVIHQQATGLNELNNSISLVVYPNPISNNQHLNIKCSEKINEIIVFNSAGVNLIKTNEIGLYNLEISKGLYFLQIHTEKGIAKTKIIVQ
jgi:hypothetical protein